MHPHKTDDVETQFLMVDYETDENFIRWDSSYSKLEGEKFSSEYDYVDRKTLDFYQYDRISKKHQKKHKCLVYSDVGFFIDRISQITVWLQKVYDMKLKDNKF